MSDVECNLCEHCEKEFDENELYVHSFGCVKLCSECGKNYCVGTSEQADCDLCNDDDDSDSDYDYFEGTCHSCGEECEISWYSAGDGVVFSFCDGCAEEQEGCVRCSAPTNF